MWLCTAVYDSVFWLFFFGGVLLCTIHLVGVRAPIVCLGRFVLRLYIARYALFSPPDSVKRFELVVGGWVIKELHIYIYILLKYSFTTVTQCCVEGTVALYTIY
jgi:hypothetical protein